MRLKTTLGISDRTGPDSIKVGKWLFRHRTWIPIPFALAMLALPRVSTPSAQQIAVLGVVLTAVGELVRLWAVGHIGAISRTRSDRLGPLIATGPFAYCRNPLYLGNIAIWVGLALTAGVLWLAPIVLVLLLLEYHAIVRWEETLLESRLGDAYRAYAARVPRWLPKSNRRGRGERRVKGFSVSSEHPATAFSWRETLFSERGTLIAIAVGYGLLWLKTTVRS